MCIRDRSSREFLSEKEILDYIYQSNDDVHLSDSFSDDDFGDEIEPRESVGEISNLASEFSWVGGAFHSIVHKFDESSSAAACIVF